MAGRCHGHARNVLIIKHHLIWVWIIDLFFGRKSTRHFITHWKPIISKNSCGAVPTGRLDSVAGTSDSPPMSWLDLTPGLCWRPPAPVRHIHVAPSIFAFHDNWRGSPCRATAAPSSKWDTASHWICPMSAHTVLQPWQVLPFLCLHFSYVWILESKSRGQLKTRHEVTAETFTVYENKSTQPLTARQ